MHKHPKTSSEALHPSDFKVIKVAVPVLGDKGPLVNRVRAAESRMKNPGRSG
jgi:hypothetical protein